MRVLFRYPGRVIGVAAFIAVSLLCIEAIVLRVQIPSLSSIVSFDQALQIHAPFIMVLGGGFSAPGVPSHELADRLEVGLALAKQSHVPLLITGDDGAFKGDEITAMKNWLSQHNEAGDVPVIEDGKGYRTYESCKHVAEEYHTQKVLLISQRFHVGRAIYLCQAFGIETYAVTANLRPYWTESISDVRDILASVKAWLDINIHAPQSPA